MLVKTMDFSPRLSVAISIFFSLREKVPVRADERGTLSLEFPLTRHFAPPSPWGRGDV